MLSRFKVGHYTDLKNGTGCTMILPPEENVSSASVRGASPGTRELALLAPEKKISQINALVLTGGSAFGLGCAHGVMEALAAQDIGYFTEYGIVPIVPAAVIFDKNIGNNLAFPTNENAHEALKKAVFNNTQQGNVGAGTGATAGKWMGINSAMKSGLGIGNTEFEGIKVTAVTVVNSVGDVLDWSGKTIAGAIDGNNRFYGSDNNSLRWRKPGVGLAENTVLSAVMTNVRLSKQEAFFLADRAHYGIARRIYPSHTNYDGDVTFLMSTPEVDANLDILSGLIVRTVEESILNGVLNAKALFGLKCAGDLK
jgi:L-aminopeptidase/D-esterase-like protein